MIGKRGALLDALEKTGQADNTVIVFTADHGEMLGERGMWFKFNPYEPSIKVPLIIHAPGAKAGQRVGQNCSLVDLLPTLLDLATDGQPPAPSPTRSPPPGASITGSVGPLINPNFKYDQRKDCVAVGMFANAPNIAVVPPELVELARRSPGKLNYAHSGVGSTNHLPVELLKTSRNLNIVSVPHKGQPPAITDVIGGQIQLFIGAPALLVQHVKTGKLMAIAVTSSKRLDDPSNVPTLAEGGTPEEFTRLLADEGARWAKRVKDANIKAE